MLRSIILFSLSFLFTAPVFAQLYSTQYRVPDQQWTQITSEHFRIIFPERYRNEAILSLSILEAEYSDIQDLVGGNLRHFPFILNPENDRSNGFVSPLNFRSEVEIAPIRGKALNPKSGNWLESVMPHELVHALHFSGNPPALTRILGLFSPDMRRSVHSAAPLGTLEGIAVHHESHGTLSQSGRGNYPYFYNQFNTLLNTPDEWSMGQLVHVTDYTPPFNRHYIGGYEFTNWLQTTYGDDATKRAIKFHYKYPFLGYGTALRHSTGKWPGELHKDFTEDVNQRESQRLSLISDNTDAYQREIPFKGKCRRLSRPIWLSESQLIFYARTCNRPAGFYLYDTETNESNLLKEVIISEDVYYSLSPDKSMLYYSRYHRDSKYDNLFRGDIYELEIQSGQTRRLSNKQRLFSPESSANNLLALKTQSYRQTLVSVDLLDATIDEDFDQLPESTIIQIASNPLRPDQTAFIGKVKGVQAIWFYDLSESQSLLSGSPDIVFENGSVFDLQWSNDGTRLLFISDHTGTMNAFEYHTDENKIYQLTDSSHNIYEASYSPDDSKISFIRQSGYEQLVFTMPISDAIHGLIEPATWTFNDGVRSQLNRPLMNREDLSFSDEWIEQEYRTGLGWLKPRLWLPTYETQSGFDKFGVTLESVDQMNSQSYSLSLDHYLDRLWFDLTYSHKTFYPGFEVDLFSRPSITNFRISETQVQSFLQQSRGVTLKAPIRYVIESNARFTSLLVEPQYTLNQLRFLDPFNSSVSYSEFGTRHTAGLRTVFNYRLRQFIRDVQPNKGTVFYTETRYGLNRDSIELNTGQVSGTINLLERKGVRGGLITYLAPFQRFNQSLQLRIEGITQTDLPVFNISSLYSETFVDDPLPAVNNIGLINTRYTIPLVYPDDGGLLLPVYLSNIYLVLFSQSAFNLNNPDLIEGSRSVYGAGIRSRFRISNLAFDIGFSIGWEPTRNNFTGHFGSF